MPFDNTTGLTDYAPDLSKPSLEGLSWLLRHREAWPRGMSGTTHTEGRVPSGCVWDNGRQRFQSWPFPTCRLLWA